MTEQLRPEGESKQSIRHQVKYRHQRNKEYQTLVGEGLASDLRVSGFCWLACLDMLSSVYLPDDKARKNTIFDIARKMKQIAALDEEGAIKLDKHIENYIEVINEQFSKAKIPFEAGIVSLKNKNDIIRQLFDENMLHIQTTNLNGLKHMIFMEGLLFYGNKSPKECMIQYWDPSGPDSHYINIKQPIFVVGNEPAIISPAAIAFQKS